MATNLVLTGLDGAAASIGFVPPVVTGLKLWVWLGVDLATSCEDKSGSGFTLSAVGAPTFDPTSANFVNGTNYLLTTVPDYDDVTLLCVARCGDTLASAAHVPGFISAYGADTGRGGTPIIGSALAQTGNSTAPSLSLQMNGGFNPSGTIVQTASPAFAVAPITNFKFLAGMLSGAGTRKIWDQTDGTNIAASGLGTRVPNTSNKFKIGSLGHASWVGGTCDMAWAAIYNRVMSDAEVAATYAFVKSYLSAKRSITI